MKHAIVLLVLVAALAAFIQKAGQSGLAPADPAFDRYKGHFLDALWKQYPDWATSAGYHRYDSVLVIPDEQSRRNDLAFVKAQLDSLNQFEVGRLSALNQIDYCLIQNQLRSTRWEIDTLRSYEWNPASYNVIGSFAFILSEPYAPLATRLRRFHQKMAAIPAYYEAVRKQLRNPVVELTKLAADRHAGGVSVMETDFADSLKKSMIPVMERQQMLSRAKTSVQAIKSHVAWLNALPHPKPRSFRLGKALYERKFAYDIQSAYTAEQVYNSALVRKQYLHRQMAQLSTQLWPRYFGSKPVPADTLDLIRRMIDTLSVQHVKPDAFQVSIEQQLPQLVAFVNQKNLLYIDPSKPLVVRKEPGYMAGVAGASISSPGPYDKNGNTYYNVGSMAGWSAERSESYLREYNEYMMQILNIHEAIPGHYTQLVYANQSPSLIKSVLSNGAMIEGWAVYTEQMMLENGYGNHQPELWLMWYKWNLRSVCNTILDYGVHTGTLSRDDVIKLLTREAFQQQAEADGKWKRVSVTSVQLTSYYTGFKEISDLREAYKRKTGDAYRLKTFNETFLSYGNAPVKYIQQLMLTN